VPDGGDEAVGPDSPPGDGSPARWPDQRRGSEHLSALQDGRDVRHGEHDPPLQADHRGHSRTRGRLLHGHRSFEGGARHVRGGRGRGHQARPLESPAPLVRENASLDIVLGEIDR
jgi:hypothetical protein